MNQQGLVEWGVSVSSCGWLGGGDPGLRDYWCVRSDGWFGGLGASLRARNGDLLGGGVLLWVCRPRVRRRRQLDRRLGHLFAGRYIIGLTGRDAGGYFSYYRIQNSISSYYDKEM